VAVTGIGIDIALAAELLRSGKLVAIPTETVYGLAANALNEEAVLSIFKVKNRPFFDPLIVHVDSFATAQRYATFSDERLVRLAKAFWPGPLTLLVPKKEMIPGIVTSGLEQVGIRIPKHPLALQLLRETGLPLAAPSANPFGYVSPTEPLHVQKQLGDKIDYILDGGPSSVGLESTIAGIEDGNVCIYRLGGLAVEDIEKITGPIELRLNQSSNPKAPGQLKSHYAPRKTLFTGRLEDLLPLHPEKKAAIICFGKDPVEGGHLVLNLSSTGNLEEAALNLFKFLRLADDSDAEVVLCELLPDKGLGRAINDRLLRAATT
jgi:L-threonylcarbamoyladenylate synthase